MKTEQEDGSIKEEKVEHKKNINEQALILITVPQVEEEEEIKVEVTGSKDDEKKDEDPTEDEPVKK